jgi:hypothetical protein
MAVACFYAGSEYEMLSGDIAVKGEFDVKTGKIKTTEFVAIKSSAPEFVCKREHSSEARAACVEKETAKAVKDFKNWYLSDFRKKANIYNELENCKPK